VSPRAYNACVALLVLGGSAWFVALGQVLPVAPESGPVDTNAPERQTYSLPVAWNTYTNARQIIWIGYGTSVSAQVQHSGFILTVANDYTNTTRLLSPEATNAMASGFVLGSNRLELSAYFTNGFWPSTSPPAILLGNLEELRLQEVYGLASKSLQGPWIRLPSLVMTNAPGWGYLKAGISNWTAIHWDGD